jgi:hypothetical protein
METQINDALAHFSTAFRILWAFDIIPVVGPDDKEILPDPEDFVSSGIFRGPKPFKFVARPRSAVAAKIVETEAAEADLQLLEWQ